MLTLVTSVPVVLLLLASLYGWGAEVRRRAYGSQELLPAYTVALGALVVLVLGGVLNALGLARAPGLALVVYAGAVLFVRELLRLRTGGAGVLARIRKVGGWAMLSGYAVAMAMAGFYLAAVVPARAFNTGDDFSYYLVRPVRMLATGSLGNDTFGCLGLDSLGGQSLFHAMAAVFLPLSCLNIVEFVLFLGLSIAILTDMGVRRRVGTWGVASGALLLAMASPMAANLSSIYSGFFLTLALIESLALAEDGGAAGRVARWSKRLVPGLFAGTLLVLKYTHAPFAACIIGVFVVMHLARTHDPRRAVGFVVGAGAGVFVSVLPWSVRVLPRLLSVPASVFASGGHSPGSTVVQIGEDLLHVVRSGTLFYGGSVVSFVVAACMCLAAVAVGWQQARKCRTGVPLLFPVSVAGLLAVMTMFALASGFTSHTAVRYASPVLAMLPALLCVLSNGAGHGQPARVFGGRSVRVGGLVVILFASALLLTSLPHAALRAAAAVRTRSTIGFPVSGRNQHAAEYLTSAYAEGLRAAQAHADSGAGLLAVVAVPPNLDFGRNRVHVLTAVGSSDRSTGIPFTADADSLRSFLRGLGIRYILVRNDRISLEIESLLQPYMRSGQSKLVEIAEKQLYLIRTLREVCAKAERVYERAPYTLIDLGEMSTGREAP